ncbi:P-loop NTPase [Pleurocapsales cyanobacterium LEGE 10410]|nr:P-loop NTPase [Pleurocapsales cyanobacterium LEGE 10410]
MFFSTLDEVPTKILQRKFQYNNRNIAGVKNIIAISSGRDRVGKNTIAVNLAVILAQFGSKVGWLDADLNSTNVSKILGLEEVIDVGQKTGDSWKPPSNFGVKLVSLASLIDLDPLEDWCEDWCNDWLDRAIKQVIERVQWGELDYLIVNLPPGIGEIQIALAQALAFDGVVTISVARPEADLDTYETLKMFERLQVPLLGLVENMSDFITPNISRRKYEIRGGEKSGGKIRVPYLGYIPFDPAVTRYGNRAPIVLAEPLSIFANALTTIVWTIVSRINASRLKS